MSGAGKAARIEETIIGASDIIRELRDLVLTAAPSVLPVWIHGETGVGKELVAEGLHEASGRRGDLVRVNVCAIPGSMWEDAFFGHARGGFTGAVGDRDGFFAEADGGTIFLDEIGSLGLPEQAKLLRVVETGIHRPVGATRDRRSSARIVSASSQDLDRLVANTQFRVDLAFRIRGLVIRVPALSERTLDIPLLARHFLSCLSTDEQPSLTLSDEAATMLIDRPWPGNVRELRQIVGCAVALSSTALIGAAEIRRAIAGARRASNGGCTCAEETDERRRLVDLLAHHQWDTLAAAIELKVSRKTVYDRIKRLGIEMPRLYHRRATPSDSPVRDDWSDDPVDTTNGRSVDRRSGAGGTRPISPPAGASPAESERQPPPVEL